MSVSVDVATMRPRDTLAHAPVALVIAWLLALVAGAALRLVWLGSLPGVNADEVWYGIQAQRLFGQHDAVQWMAPSGRPLLSPLLWLWALLGEIIAPSSLLWLRLPTAFASIAVVASTPFALAPLMGTRASLCAAMLFSALPVDVAAARMGWDPSLLPLCTLALVGCAARARWVACAVVVIVGVLTHPTFPAVFPLAIAAAVAARARAGSPWPRGIVIGAVTLACFVMLLALLLGEDIAHFAGGFVDVVTGEATFAWIVDRRGAGRAPAVVGYAFIVAPALLALVHMRGGRHREAALCAGAFFAIALVFFAVGAPATLPRTSRFAFITVAPFAWSLCTLVGRAHAAPSPAKRTPPIALAALGALVVALSALSLARVVDRYFLRLRADGSRADPAAFATNDVEPRIAIARALTQQHVKLVGAEGWWLALPLEYFGRGAFTVERIRDAARAREILTAGGVVVVIADRPLAGELAQDDAHAHTPFTQAGGTPAFVVVK